MIKRSLHLASIAATVLLASCTVSPTAGELGDVLEEQLRSVRGPWQGLTFVPSANGLTLEFSLTEQSGGRVQGNGTMREREGGNVPITVTGTFQRPTLALTFTGIVFEGRAVTAAFVGDYTTVGGISGSLVLRAEGYERTIPILLQER